MQPERRVMTGREDHPQRRRPAGEQEIQLCQCPGLEQLVQVVDDEQDGLVERVRPGSEPHDDRFAVEFGRWREILDRPVHADDATQRLDNRQPEPLRIALVAVDGYPGGSLAQARGLDP